MDDSIIFDRYFNLSLRFLSYRPRSEKEVIDYLKKKLSFAKATEEQRKLSEKTIAQIMQRLIELKFIDDLEFAKFWIEHRKKGFRFVKLELRQKGISEDIIEVASSEFDVVSKEDKLLKKLIEKKSKSLKNLPKQKAYEKMVGFLLRKGFDYDLVKKQLKEFEF